MMWKSAWIVNNKHCTESELLLNSMWFIVGMRQSHCSNKGWSANWVFLFSMKDDGMEIAAQHVSIGDHVWAEFYAALEPGQSCKLAIQPVGQRTATVCTVSPVCCDHFQCQRILVTLSWGGWFLITGTFYIVLMCLAPSSALCNVGQQCRAVADWRMSHITGNHCSTSRPYRLAWMHKEDHVAKVTVCKWAWTSFRLTMKGLVG